MLQFRADLHIHSRYSRATSKRLSPSLLAAWAMVKGLHVLGTSDFTHPQWRAELQDFLDFDAKSGLYTPKNTSFLTAELPHLADMPHTRPPYFMLQGEISSIYKKDGKVRKVHSLVFMPDFAAAERFCQKLGAIGNLKSDGRPIVGLDVRHLLEMVLETAPDAFMVPAHIWTPWFSLFGSKSGFDSMEECFGDLTSEIFALETGLSSDPAMNRCWSALDNYRLISNSDAHSGENLGREANLFQGELSYAGILQALKHPEASPETQFLGTLEFFPEEGKYHLDGHRECGIVFAPQETATHKGLCPVCGKNVTVGVLHRVRALADRGEPAYPKTESFTSLIPLPEILSELSGVGVKTRTVNDLYTNVIRRLGPELDILTALPEADITQISLPLGQAITRMRKGNVQRDSGYDGEYGVISVFSAKERMALKGGKLLVPLLGEETAARKKKIAKKAKPVAPPKATLDTGIQASIAPALPKRMEERKQGLNAQQQQAVQVNKGEAAVPTLVLAGPGTGKTRTLIGRVLTLVQAQVPVEKIVALTFTRRAAQEMKTRLAQALYGLCASEAPLPRADTLHALAYELWHSTHSNAPTLLSEENARRVFDEVNAGEVSQKLRSIWQYTMLARERMEPLPEEYKAHVQRYEQHKYDYHLADYTDLLEYWLEQIERGLYICPWEHILVDEIQDLSHLQLSIIHALLPDNGVGFFGIGDPDQSIYSFRGAQEDIRHYLQATWPSLQTLALTNNYRSAAAILTPASALMQKHSLSPPIQAVQQGAGEVHLFAAHSAEAEAVWIARQVRYLLGAGSHTLDEQVEQGGSILPAGAYSPGDITVLVRIHILMPVIRKALARAGIPCSTPASDGFWVDPRVDALLRIAGQGLGLAPAPAEETAFNNCPELVITKGPVALAAYFADIPPFDAVFWKSLPFKGLVTAYEQHASWSALINWINLQNELELVQQRGERVQIMSLHAAKGLEFPIVFLPGLEDGILPFAGMGMLTGKPGREQFNAAEERRLLYVGMTRASEALFMSWAERRKLYGRELRFKASRFLQDMPTDRLIRSALVKQHTKQEQQLSLL